MLPFDAAYERALRLFRSEGARERPSSASMAAAGERVCRQLQRALTRWFGARGARALLTLAIERTCIAHPILKEVRFAESGRADGMNEAPDAFAVLEGARPDEAASACASLIAEIIVVLGQLVGEDAAHRLLDQEWPDFGEQL